MAVERERQTPAGRLIRAALRDDPELAETLERHRLLEHDESYRANGDGELLSNATRSCQGAVSAGDCIPDECHPGCDLIGEACAVASGT